jgi:hypothetical protein
MAKKPNGDTGFVEFTSYPRDLSNIIISSSNFICLECDKKIQRDPYLVLEKESVRFDRHIIKFFCNKQCAMLNRSGGNDDC